MADLTITSILTTQQNIGSGDSVIIGRTGGIFVHSGAGLYNTSGGSGDLYLLGDIVSTSGMGVHFNSVAFSDIHIASGANIIANTEGIYQYYNGYMVSQLTNAGTIEADGTAVYVNGAGTGIVNLFNTGDIIGNVYGAYISNVGTIDIVNSGSIIGGAHGIFCGPGAGQTAVIRNSGEITGGSDVGVAVLGGSGSIKLKNSGLIQGDVDFGDQDDVYNGRFGVVQGEVRGDGGEDVLIGGMQHDNLSGGDDADVLYGRGGDDLLKGGAAGDVLRGNSGDDTLDGGSGGDSLHGGRGNDYLFGGSKSDTLNGGWDDDILEGGGGSDHFAFDRKGGTDRIIDFADGVDLIDLSALNLASFNQLNNNGAFTNLVGALEIDLNAVGVNTVIIIDGVQKADMSAADFVF